MLTLNAETRDVSEKVSALRQEEWLPGVVYGFEMATQPIKVKTKDFEKIYREAGENTLVALQIKDGQSYDSLIQEVQRDPLTEQPVHVDFYHPSAKKKIEAWIPIDFEGESPAVRDFGGTVLKEMKELEVKGLAAHLPHEIKVDLSALKQPHDRILVKDLSVGSEIEILSDPESIVAMAVPAESVEEELEKPVEDSVEPVKPEETEEEQPKEE